MRRATMEDVPGLVQLYTNVAVYANSVGSVQWPIPFPEDELLDYLSRGEIFCFEEPDTAAARVHTEPRQEVWQDTKDMSDFLYLAKLAVSESCRHSSFTDRIILPQVKELTNEREFRGIRLECLPENTGLIHLYSRLGFVSLGDVSFFSKLRHKTLTLHRFEMSVASFS